MLQSLVITAIPSTEIQDPPEGIIAVVLKQITWVMPIGSCARPGYVQSTAGAQVSPMLATTVKCLIEEKGVMRTGDKQMCAGGFTPSGGGAEEPCSCEVEIDDTMQDKLLGS